MRGSSPVSVRSSRSGSGTGRVARRCGARVAVAAGGVRAAGAAPAGSSGGTSTRRTVIWPFGPGEMIETVGRPSGARVSVARAAFGSAGAPPERSTGAAIRALPRGSPPRGSSTTPSQTIGPPISTVAKASAIGSGTRIAIGARGAAAASGAWTSAAFMTRGRSRTCERRRRHSGAVAFTGCFG